MTLTTSELPEIDDDYRLYYELAPAAREALARYGFPGNIRELENIIARAVAIADGADIQSRDLPPFLAIEKDHANGGLKSLEEMERAHIAAVLKSVGGHRDRAAAILGITRSTLWRKIQKYGLDA